MSNLIATPLPIVYINPNKEVTIREGVDMSYSNDIYGIQIPVVVDYRLRSIFVNRLNGPDTNTVGQYNLSVFEEQAATLMVERENSSPLECVGREHIMCVRDLMALRKIQSLFNDTVKILRENHVCAEEIRDGLYWALSDNAWNLRDSTQAELYKSDHYQMYSVDMNEKTHIFECVKTHGTSYDVASRADSPRYHVRTAYMLNKEPKVSPDSLLGKVVAKYFY